MQVTSSILVSTADKSWKCSRLPHAFQDRSETSKEVGFFITAKDFRETANLLLQSFLGKIAAPLQTVKIEIVTDHQLLEVTNNSFSCSVVLKQGLKQLPPEKIYITFTGFPMIKFFGLTWTEFQGDGGIAPFLTVIRNHFAK